MTPWFNIGSQQLHLFQSFVVFLKAVVSNNGQVMTQRHLWRYIQMYFGKIATDQQLGISSCYWRLCTLWGLAYVSCISGILLHRSAGYHYWGNTSRANGCSQSISSIPRHLYRTWDSAWWIHAPKATFPCPLSCSHSVIWCPQRPLFLHHGI